MVGRVCGSARFRGRMSSRSPCWVLCTVARRPPWAVPWVCRCFRRCCSFLRLGSSLPRVHKPLIPKIVLSDAFGKYLFTWDSDHLGPNAPTRSPCDGFYSNADDPHVQQAIMTMLKAGCAGNDAVMDLGSNVGVFMLQMRAFGCPVVAVEPQRALNRLLVASLKVNEWWYAHSVELHWAGNGVRRGEMKITGKLWMPGGRGNFRVDESAPSAIPIIPISSLFESRRRYRLAQIDIDGPEAPLLRELGRYAPALDSIIIEITWSRFPEYGVSFDEGERSLNALFDAGYEVFLVFEKEFSKYPDKILAQLQEHRPCHSIERCYQIPKPLICQVMDMNSRSTKNLFFVKPDALPPP